MNETRYNQETVERLEERVKVLEREVDAFKSRIEDLEESRNTLLPLEHPLPIEYPSDRREATSDNVSGEIPAIPNK